MYPGWTLGAVLYENSKVQHDCEQAADDDDDDGQHEDNDDDDIRVLLSRLLIVGTDKNVA